MNDGDPAYNKFLILHEFGHALGCIHEHQHPERSADFLQDSPEVLAYFANALRNERGPASRAVIDANVFDLFNKQDLIKFSDYDTESIMHYAFPGWMFRDGLDRVQNFVLSKLDMLYAAIVYPAPDGPKVKPGDEADDPVSKPKPSEVRKLTIDGDRVNARVGAGETIKFRFAVSSSASD
ncbi:MAG TPA: hypothetical protein PLY87_31270, partial [Planctomycetaceae bacterium]|nr:hypothetical protein [Planctomycetaceae bacterium]